DPDHGESLGRALDLGGPRDLRGDRIERGARAAGAIVPEPVERIDRAVVVGPVHAERVTADQVHVLGNVRAWLTQDLEAALLHVPPPTAGRVKRIPASM